MKNLISKIRAAWKSGLALGYGLITTGIGFIGFGVSVLAMSLGLVAVFAYALAIACFSCCACSSLRLSHR